MTQPLIRLVIVDDHPHFRDALRRWLAASTDLIIKVLDEEGSDGTEAVRLARQLKPDVLLLNLHMPTMSGLEALRELSEELWANALPVKVILLTADIEKSEIVEAVQLGARGVVFKEAVIQVLLKAIQTVMAGEYWLGREPMRNAVRLFLLTAGFQPYI